VLAGALGRYEEADALIDAARAASPALPDTFDVAIAAMAEAVVWSALHPHDEALDLAIRAAHAMAAIDSDVGEAYMWQTAGTLALTFDPENAHTYLTDALQLADLMENDGLRGQGRTLLGYCARRIGRADEALELFISAAEASQRSGQRSSMAYALDGLAAAALDLGQPEAAARALASSEAVRSSIDRTPWAAFHPLLDEVAEATRAQLGDAAYAAARDEGARSDVGHALRTALDTVVTSSGGR
jgi:tetratricopeptide (TPR) repeat protein